MNDREKLEETILDVLLDHYSWRRTLEYCYCECGARIKPGEIDHHIAEKIADRLMEEQ